MSNGLVCKITEIKDKLAVLEIDGQKIEVKKEELPASASVGAEFNVFLLEKEQRTIKEKKLAKEILEEILNGE